MSSKNPGCLAAIFGIKPKQQKRQAKGIAQHPPTALTTEQKTGLLTTQHSSAISTVEDGALLSTAENVTTIPHFASKGILLTHTEVAFFHVLRNMIKDYLVIIPHVALRDLISVVVDQSEYFTYYNKIDRKQVDFVLCDPQTLKPVFAIELDDVSHNRPDRIKRDAFVEKIFEEAKISLVRIPVSNDYDTQKLGAMFKEAIGKYVEHKNETPNHHYSIDNPPLCRKHGVRMVLRKARQTGEKFWGCPNYPQCKEIIKLKTSPT